MTAPVNPADPPLAEPGKRPTGSDVGGIRSTPQAGVAEAARRSSERGDDAATVPAGGAAIPALAATVPAGARSSGSARADEDEEEEWRHEPVAPIDETNPLRSLGKAVGDTLTGSEGQTPVRPKR